VAGTGGEDGRQDREEWGVVEKGRGTRGSGIKRSGWGKG
jgi:hypothetical protein